MRFLQQGLEQTALHAPENGDEGGGIRQSDCNCNRQAGNPSVISLQLQLQLNRNDPTRKKMANREPDLWFSFVRAHRVLIREIERRLDEAGLPAYAWYDVLWGVESGKGGTRRMHELADALAIERYNLTRLVDRLERENLVVRSRSAEDGRAAFVSITDAGRALRKKMWKVYQAAVAENFLPQFEDMDRGAIVEALDRAAAMARGDDQPS